MTNQTCVRCGEMTDNEGFTHPICSICVREVGIR